MTGHNNNSCDSLEGLSLKPISTCVCVRDWMDAFLPPCFVKTVVPTVSATNDYAGIVSQCIVSA